MSVIGLDLLATSPFFRAFRSHERGMVAALLKVRAVTAGELLFAEGEPGLVMYVVVEGTLRITKSAAPHAPVLETLGPGDSVGEMALLLGEPRGAACWAATAGRVGVLTKSDFDALLAQQPGIAIALGRLMAQRLQRANQMAVPSLLATQTLGLGDGERITLGREPTNHVVLPSPAVAPHQAEIVRQDSGRYLARTLAETGAPLTVNGRRVSEAPVADGDTLKVGPYRFILRDTLAARGGAAGSVWLRAVNLSVARGGATLLHDISLDIRPGEFVAITGSSGAGKSTLLNALNGFRPASRGHVMINDVSLYDNLAIFRRAVGFVPQDDVVHSALPLGRALHYTARLRVPAAPAVARAGQQAALARRITQTIKLLGLEEQRDLPISSLSGGQRKRASIGVELITEPSLFCLDEPMSGLDPAAEVRMMALLRQISERGQTVVMVTHATETIGMCHRVIFLARGGYLAFAGTPADALTHFQVDEFDAIYTLLDHEHTPAYWAELFARSPYAVSPGADVAGPVPRAAAPARPARRGRGSLHQLIVLTQRYAEILRRDTRTLTLMVLQAPLIGLLMWAVFPQDVFSPNPAVGSGRSALMVLFILTATAVFFGASNASKELVKERAIFRRERLVNLSLPPYVLSKTCILGAIGMAQSVVLVAVCALGGLLPMGAGPAVLAGLVGVLTLTVLAGTGLGLLLSAIASSADFATSMVPLIILPQLMFSGVLVPLSQMSFLSTWLAQVTVTKWSFELLGRLTGLADVFRAQNTATSNVLRANYEAAFTLAGWPSVAVLAGFIVAFLVGTTVALELRNRLS
ncbi:MAG: hypothetical protein NVSMB65_10930 [Chloroflexota bacterium]